MLYLSLLIPVALLRGIDLIAIFRCFGIVVSTMKSDIHPKYFGEAKATCACGVVYSVGSTKEKMEIEICRSCHPFYSGAEKIIDTAGRVEKFKARAAKKVVTPPKKKETKVEVPKKTPKKAAEKPAEIKA